MQDKPYSVHVGAGILSKVGEIASHALREPSQRAFVAADWGVPSPAVKTVLDSLGDRGVRPSAMFITPSEEGKSWDSLKEILTRMAQSSLGRSAVLVSLGGGVVGDMAGFAASVYCRGIPVIQCPTTLLAMVDASVGGKTGVNLELPGYGLLKNYLGTFWQPAAVVADVEVLRSLPRRELSAGLAECIKHGLMGSDVEDPDLLDWTQANMGRVFDLDMAVIEELVTRNVSAKARIVSSDELEKDTSGGRALLNLGHTFGHAIETLPGLSPNQNRGNVQLLHGEAVGLGLVAAAVCSSKLGLCPVGLVDQVRDLLARAGLPTKVAGLPSDEVLLTLMGHDKKAVGGAMRLVLPVGGGRAKVVANPARDAVVAGLAAIRG